MEWLYTLISVSFESAFINVAVQSLDCYVLVSWHFITFLSCCIGFAWPARTNNKFTPGTSVLVSKLHGTRSMAHTLSTSCYMCEEFLNFLISISNVSYRNLPVLFCVCFTKITAFQGLSSYALFWNSYVKMYCSLRIHWSQWYFFYSSVISLQVIQYCSQKKKKKCFRRLNIFTNWIGNKWFFTLIVFSAVANKSLSLAFMYKF